MAKKFTVSTELHQRAKAIARREGVTVEEVVARALANGIDRIEANEAIQRLQGAQRARRLRRDRLDMTPANTRTAPW